MKTDLPNNQQRPTVAKPLLYDVLKECLSTTITDAEKMGTVRLVFHITFRSYQKGGILTTK